MGISANWSRENLAWAAGLFEGEGCIFVSKKKGITLYLSMTDEDVVRKIHSTMGVGKVNGPYKQVAGTSRKESYKPAWTWSVGRAEMVQAVLAAFWCFLGERRKRKAKEAILLGATKRPKGALVTSCKRGHEYTQENTYMNRLGYRQCRECMRTNCRINQRILRARKKEEKNEPRYICQSSGGNSV